MADVKPILRGKIVQAIGDDQIKWLRANQNFARIQGFLDQVERYWSVPKFPPLGFGLPFPFGDGGLGDVTLTANTTISSYDIREYKNLTVNSGVTLSTTETATAVMILYASERLILDGTLDMDTDGGAGGLAGNPGVDGTDYITSYGGSGAGGGAKFSGVLGGAGGSTIIAGGVAGSGAGGDGAAGAVIGNSNLAAIRMRQDALDEALVSWGAGGGGGGNTTTTVGKGGSGGGAILIFAQELIVASTGIITADGENGEDGINGVSKSGGGGGGAGGLIFIMSRKITNSGSIAATGGAGGTAGDPDGGDGGVGGAGTVIQEEIP